GGDGVRLGDVGTLDPALHGRLWVGFDERAAGLDVDFVGADAQLARLAPGLASADVELPAVPAAGQDLALARVADLSRGGRLPQAPEQALAEGTALMRAAVAKGEELAR